ncbi:MAG: 16S rRNA processing protein RimM [Deltaproteobacteria bacterium]|nr:16S rRNA processing protein RimM [Candidatus Anaeroferrophillus wilburensis]MBN2889079.1 16S rRNA processing protein RimM [Deltaproteobacteria bacterium]
MADSWLVLGKIVKSHGLRGDVKVVLLGESLENLTLPGVHLRLPGGRLVPVTLAGGRPVSGGYIFHLDGYADVNAVQSLIPAEVVVRAENLPTLADDEYYHFQLLGLTVKDTAGTVLGTLDEIMQTGAHDVYCIRGQAGMAEVLVPAAAPFIVSIDLEARCMVVDLQNLQEGE